MGRLRGRDRDPRLPPGQYDVGSSWPELTAEPAPTLPARAWTLTVDGLVDTPTTWSRSELQRLPTSTYTGDIHCVTSWSKLGTSFTGVEVGVLLDIAAPDAEATYVVATSATGYTTTLTLDDVHDGWAWVVWAHEGDDLPREHGGPLRLLVPHLYLWKSAKWISRITLLDHDEPGFWEVNGYHDRGDPWREERYQGD
jgi:DMSO/TMAO reductase YedYZ molybdopterin-dependent catalytic subunit